MTFRTKDARRTINKFVPEPLRELAMWCIALVVNASTWADFKHQWTLICAVFIQLHRGDDRVNAQTQDALLDKISKLRSDPNTVDGMRRSEQAEDDDEKNLYHHDSYDFNDEDIQIGHSRPSLPQSRQRKVRRCSVKVLSIDRHGRFILAIPTQRVSLRLVAMKGIGT